MAKKKRKRLVKEWVAVGDDKTCDECDAMDGKRSNAYSDFRLSDDQPRASDYFGDSIEGPPLHPNCRCEILITYKSKVVTAADRDYVRDDHGRFGSGGGGGKSKPEKSGPDVEPREATPKEFRAAFGKAFPKGSEFENHVTHYTEDQLRGMRCYVSKDGTSGVALHDHGDGRVEATALFNNGGPKGAGLAMLAHAIGQGANYVECYGPHLNQMYEKLGFKSTNKYAFDPSMAAPGWDAAKFDSPDYHTMSLGGA